VDIEERTDNPFIAMEYIRGKTLKSYISEQQLTFDACISFAIQICHGLSEAHRADIIHRDIKSDNIMICDDDRIKIMDFGLVKLKGTLNLTKNTSTIGTLAYMPPEQIEGKESDRRSDIFSFGIVLYEMLVGELPFKGDYEAALMYAILNEQPEPVQNYRPDIPSELVHVVNRAMEKDPENRYQSVDDMLIDLKRLKRDSSHVSRTSLADLPASKKPVKRKRNIYLTVSVIILLCLAVFIIYNFWPSPDLEQSSVYDERSVAVMYFSNNTGDKSLDHWSRALADLMTTDLAQSKYLRVLGGDKLYDILAELDQLEESNFSAQILQQIAEKGRVSHVIYGHITRAGEDFRININIKKPLSDELLSAEMVEGHGEKSIFTMVDDLTLRIKEKFALSEDEISSDPDQLIANITTSSPQALRYYVLGHQKFDEREYRESINYYEKAIKEDPEFAMAYRTAAIAFGNMGYSSERQDYLEKALEMSHRVSLREKYLIEGDYYQRTDKQKAIDSYEKLLAIYPYDVTGNINLGMLYNNIRELNKALTCFKNGIIGDPSVLISYMDAAWVYTELAKYDSAKYYLEMYRTNYEDNEIIRAYLSEFHLYKHEYDLALLEINEALKIKPNDFNNHEFKGDIYLCMGHFDSAETVYKQMFDFEEKVAHLRAHSQLAALALLQGKTKKRNEEIKAGLALTREIGEKGWECGFLFSAATGAYLLKKYDKALTLYEDIIKIAKENDITGYYYWALHFKADMLSRTGLKANAIKIAEEIKEVNLNDLSRWWHGNYLYLYGKMAMHDGDFPQAIDSIKSALGVLTPDPEKSSKAYMYYDLAHAFDQNGESDSAIAYYNKLISLTIGRIYPGHIYAQSFYYLGKIYQNKGWDGKAIESYLKFLDLWKNADYDFRQIGEARKQLDILEAIGNRQ
jgi:tetratricopeptide (TPR) repeat protein